MFRHGATPCPPPRISILERIALNDLDSTEDRGSMFPTTYLAVCSAWPWSSVADADQKNRVLFV